MFKKIYGKQAKKKVIYFSENITKIIIPSVFKNP